MSVTVCVEAAARVTSQACPYTVPPRMHDHACDSPAPPDTSGSVERLESSNRLPAPTLRLPPLIDATRADCSTVTVAVALLLLPSESRATTVKLYRRPAVRVLAA